MSAQFLVAIVGSGPAGLSAAAHAAQLGLAHVLLEAEQQASNTLFKYQKGKHVMAEPGILPLRSPLAFQAGTREAILAGWNDALRQHQVNVRYGANVTAISGQRGDFLVTLADGSTLSAETVVLAIGLQGNIRKFGVPGEELPGVQYQLDDPGEYQDETIVVVGGGDAGIENALALAGNNRVFVIGTHIHYYLVYGYTVNGKDLDLHILDPWPAGQGGTRTRIGLREFLEMPARVAIIFG